MNSEDNEASEPKRVSRGQLVGDTVVFQIKLAIDGLRDLLLIPVSMIAAIISFVKPGPGVGSEFYDVVAFGKDTERQINLFGAAKRMHPDEDEAAAASELDAMLGKVEGYMRREYHGERFSRVRSKLEEALQRMDKRGEEKSDSP